MAMKWLRSQLLCRNRFRPAGLRIARNLNLDAIHDTAFRNLELSMQEMNAEGVMGIVANKKLTKVLEDGAGYLWLFLGLAKTIGAARQVNVCTKILGGSEVVKHTLSGSLQSLQHGASDEDRGFLPYEILSSSHFDELSDCEDQY